MKQSVRKLSTAYLQRVRENPHMIFQAHPVIQKALEQEFAEIMSGRAAASEVLSPRNGGKKVSGGQVLTVAEQAKRTAVLIRTVFPNGASIHDLAAAAKLAEPTIRNYLASAIKQGLLVKTHQDKNRRMIYQVPEKA